MHSFPHLRGVYAAALTPLNDDYSLALDDIIPFLAFLSRRGCHGALLMGTTGEGPSFAPAERLRLLQTALEIRQEIPGFRLLLGTGTPSLDETIDLTRAAFNLGADGVVVLPPYYFHGVSDDGLFVWFSQVIERAVPEDAALLGYHIPSMTGVPLSIDLLSRLKNAYPTRFAGIKDSSADAGQPLHLDRAFGDDLLVLSGTDSLFNLALDHHAGGCITAMANLRSPDLRTVWEVRQGAAAAAQIIPAELFDGASLSYPLEFTAAQHRLETGRRVMGRYPPNPPLYKALLARWHPFRRWNVRPPLLPLSGDRLEAVARESHAEMEGFSD